MSVESVKKIQNGRSISIEKRLEETREERRVEKGRTALVNVPQGPLWLNVGQP